MHESTIRAPFADLPAALVEEMIGKTAAAGSRLLAAFQQLEGERVPSRQRLLEQGLILHESSLGNPPPPTTCATDGSYALDRLLSVDLAVAAAVAVEGLTPPSETRHWSQPRHTTFMACEPHRAETGAILAGLMLGGELTLATSAPHGLVLLDGSLVSPAIQLDIAMSTAMAAPDLESSSEFLGHAGAFLESYAAILHCPRSDRNYAALPKYSTRREVGHTLGWPGGYDDRAMLTLILEPGELTRPLPQQAPPPQQAPARPGRFAPSTLPPGLRSTIARLEPDISRDLDGVQVFHYKPHHWLPALRVEVAREVALNPHRLATVVQGLRFQCASPSMLEPYPLYLADRTVNALARAIPAFRHVTTQQVSASYGGDVRDLFLALHAYRSELGG